MASPFTPATIPAGTFTGGTVTSALTVDTGTDVTQLTIDGSANENTDTVVLTPDAGDPGIQLGIYPDQAVINMGGGVGSHATIDVEADGATLELTAPANARTVFLSAVVGGDLADFAVAAATKLRISDGGYLILKTLAAPADAVLAASEVAFWFDPTDGVGNTKLMGKAKSADGTVKTATIATFV